MTEQELAALVQILNRALMTQAEALWLNGFIKRLQDALVAKQAAEQAAKDTKAAA